MSSTWFPFLPGSCKAVAVGAIMILAAVNMLGVSLGSGILRALAALKLGLLGFLVVWGFALGTRRLVQPHARSGRSGRAPIHSCRLWHWDLIGAFISFAGWWDASKLAGEIRDPERNLPRALILGVSIVTVVYIAVSVVFLYLVSPARIAADDTAFAALAGEALFWAEPGELSSRSS